MPGHSVCTLPFFAPRDAMLTMLVCATRWLSIHIYMLAHMLMHESFLPVCHLYFNTMKSWTSDPNLHLSLADTTFCLLSCLFSFSFVSLLSCFFACYVYHAYLLYASFICSLHLFLPLLVYWFLIFAFAHGARTHGARAWFPKRKQKKRARMQACGYKPSNYV